MAKKSKKASVRYSIQDIAENCDDVSPDDAKEVFNTLTAVLEQMEIGSKVAVHGIGVFEKVKKPARTARNPKTGEKVDVPSKVAIKFKIASGLKNL